MSRRRKKTIVKDELGNEEVQEVEIEEEEVNARHKHAEKIRKQDEELRKVAKEVVEEWDVILNGRIIHKKRNKYGSVSSSDMGKAPKGK